MIMTLYFLCPCLTVTVVILEHLSFKGIPIEGSMSEFCQKLRAKGFTHMSTDDNPTLFNGDFTGRNAVVGVTATDDGRDVYSVGVFFDESEEWNTLVNTYDYYKHIYSRKYGNPTQCTEHNPSRSDSNISLMSELNQVTVTWISSWSAIGGNINVYISKSDIYKGRVVIVYRDSQNTEAKIQKDIDDI